MDRFIPLTRLAFKPTVSRYDIIINNKKRPPEMEGASQKRFASGSEHRAEFVPIHDQTAFVAIVAQLASDHFNWHTDFH